MRRITKPRYKDSLIEDLRQLLSFISRRRKQQIVLLFLLILLSSFSEAVSLGALLPFLRALSNPDEFRTIPQFVPIFDALQIESATQVVTWLAGAFITTIIVASTLRLFTLNAQLRLSAAVGSDLGCSIYHKVLHQPYHFHSRHNSSDLMQTLVDDLQRVNISVLKPALAFLSDSILALCLMGAILLIDTHIALSAAIVLGGAYILIYQLRRRLLEQNSKTVSRAGQRRIKLVQEGLGGIRDILTTSSQEYFQTSYRSADYAFRRAQAMNAILAQSPKFIVEAIAMVAIAFLALGLGKDGDFSQVVPVLGGLALGAKRLLPALQSVFFSAAQIQGSRASLRRVLASLKRQEDPCLTLPSPSENLPLNRKLKLENIWFRYNDQEDWILKNLNMEIEAKTTVAFVGSTGSGKSTTADLILGLLTPEKGVIMVDGKVVEGETLRQWQRGVAHVPQTIFLMDASIAENIAFAVPKEQIDFERVRKAARLAQVEDYIESLPAKYETYVGERGVRLSGGQRQRIGIARALYHEASIIVFDEATSALDNSTEREVMSAIDSLNRQFTIILIAHRLSTVENCDKIFELERGKIIGEGTYGELKLKSPTFQKMVAVNSSKSH